MTRICLLMVAVAIAALAMGAPSAARETPALKEAAVVFERDVLFGQAGDNPLTLNLARPRAAAAPRPCVVVIHGGGWASGRKEHHDNLVRVMAHEGYVAATVEYGLCPHCPWPAQIHDVKAAVRFLRTNAKKYGIDPERVAALGFSAGAHLAMLLGTLDPADGLEGVEGDGAVSSKVQAVVAFFGPTDMDELANQGKSELERNLKRLAFERLLGPNYAKDPSRMSPVRYVDGKDAPMLLFQGTRDRLVPYPQALRMLERLHEARIPAEITFLVGQGHGWRDPILSATVEQTRHFLDRRFRPERILSFRERLKAAGG